MPYIPAASAGFSVNIFRFIFGIYNFLAVVQSVITGKHVAQSHRKQKIRHSLKAKKLKADEQGSDGTVGNAAEHGPHSRSSAQIRRKSHQISKEAAKCASDKKGGDNFAAFKSCPKGYSRKENL